VEAVRHRLLFTLVSSFVVARVAVYAMIETMTDKTTATNTKLPTHRTDNDPQPTSSVAENAQLIAEEILIEEVSIDGMCGVY